ncbi:hypothetical protein M8C13_36355 [Crossiella sp. SN42]|uniref:hypothetical protein n=1 Tax=Crossiella sp. SN42 TaxID=2944808 RepID=UPI00207D4407|nr:hypothetical protein [Crossiella sp. SN42]MCO1581237.1 hypothetical protein [Crossiella sp. SN42]
MTTDRADHPLPEQPRLVPLDDLFRDVAPVESVADLACDGVFDTDEELNAFLEHTYSSRRASIA